MLKVQIIIFDGFDELDAIAPFEVLNSAAAIGAEIEAQLVTLDRIREITAAHSLKVTPAAQLNLDEPPDILIVPGGGWANRSDRGAWAEAQKGEIPAAIASLFDKGTIIASVCTGAMLVATAALLTESPATTHHSAIADLQDKGAKVTQARVVDNDKIITAAGVTSGLELSLWLLERFLSPLIAYEVEREMEYERRGTVWRK